jgi:hypothetical protein
MAAAMLVATLALLVTNAVEGAPLYISVTDQPYAADSTGKADATAAFRSSPRVFAGG